MKKIIINSDNRRFNISSIVVGYLEENKEEVLEFEIPEKYSEYGKKACFSANGQTFAKTFDDIISNKLTITRDISQYKELDMTIAFFKIENEDEIVARTSILHILIENAIICDDDIKPDEPKIIILDNLIDEVTKLDVIVTKNEKKREEYYQEIQKKVDNGDFNGATFTPSVDTEGNISWTNGKNLPNPTTQNIKGPKGPKGDTYNLTEQDKKDISSMTVESSESMFNQYYNDKLKDFNSNATSKTNDYNTNAISKTNEFNTNADNKIAEYDLHSQELDNKIIDTRNELERVKNDILETGEASDTYITLNDSAMAEYQELSVDGVCEQDTTSVSAGDEYDSPSPDHPQPISVIENSLKITSCNKNVWDEKWEIGSLSIENGGAVANDKFIRSLNYIPIKPNTNYYGVYQNGTFADALYYDKNKKYISKKTWAHFENKSNLTPSNAYYCKIVLDSLNYENKFALINGTNGEYEQHLETQITANLPEGEFIGKINDTYKDTLKVEYNEEDGQYHLVLNKMVCKVVLDGANNELYGNTSTDYYWEYFRTSFKSGIGTQKSAIVNYLNQTTNARVVIIENGTLYLRFPKSSGIDVSTNTKFNEWAKDHNVIIYYALKTPYVVDLGIVDMPITYNEVTNLFTDSDLLPQINAKYYRNFISTVRNLQVNEKALKQELIDINTRLSALETAQTNVASESEVVE